MSALPVEQYPHHQAVCIATLRLPFHSATYWKLLEAGAQDKLAVLFVIRSDKAVPASPEMPHLLYKLMHPSLGGQLSFDNAAVTSVFFFFPCETRRDS